MIELFASLGFWVSAVCFLAATYMTFDAFHKAPQSGLKTVLSYLFIGTGVLFVTIVFNEYATDFYGLTDESVIVWWHLMFYLAMISYWAGFKTLAKLGTTEVADTTVSTAQSKLWGYLSLFLLAVLFVLPRWADSVVNSYNATHLANFGLHHFVAFILAGIVGAYLFMAKLFFGQIGKAIASPMIIAIWAVSLQHFWELLNESWKVVVVDPQLGEGVEKILLTVAAVCIIFATLRLKKFVSSAPATA